MGEKMTDDNKALTTTIPAADHGTAVAMQREDTEVKAAYTMARMLPRNEDQARINLIKSCRRPTFADDSTYNFPRGDTRVIGPSVDLAREAARCWGNLRYGLRVVSKDEDWIHVEGFAVDLETNNGCSMPDKFRRLIQRKGKGWVTPDERDERELTNRRGAICVRNALLQVLPRDYVEDAMVEAAKTMEDVAKKQMKENPEEAIKKLVDAFDKLGVTVAMLEKRLGHPMKMTTAKETVELRQVYKSLMDGNSKREEVFEVPAPIGEAATRTIDGLFAGKIPQSES